MLGLAEETRSFLDLKVRAGWAVLVADPPRMANHTSGSFAMKRLPRIIRADGRPSTLASCLVSPAGE